jgi:hypothetical protein
MGSGTEYRGRSMTTPDDGSQPLAEVEQALDELRQQILKFFESNPLDDDAHQQLDKDALYTQVVGRIQQQPAVPAQTAPAAPHAAPATTPHTTPAAPHTAPATPHAPTPKPGTAHTAKKAAVKPPDDAELSGPQWEARFQEIKDHSLGGLGSAFGASIGEFKAAMEKAGIKVGVIDTLRSEERAYLMHWSFLIGYRGTAASEADADRLEKVKIRWEHPDPAESVKAAKELFGKFGIDPNLQDAPGRHSNHIKGMAVDMTTTWDKDSITILDAKNQEVSITTAPHSGMNPKLWEVGKTYGVWHYGTWSNDMSKPSHDRNHWSVDGH